MKFLTMLMLLLPLLAVPAAAAVEYELEISRAGSNLYYHADEDLYIRTRYCFSAQESADVLLRIEAGDSGIMTFVDTGIRCEVSAFYSATEIAAGDYRLRVSRDDDNWYGIVDRGAALKTSGCLSQVENVEAVMTIDDEGRGTLYLPAVDEECSVEAIYSRARLE